MGKCLIKFWIIFTKLVWYPVDRGAHVYRYQNTAMSPEWSTKLGTEVTIIITSWFLLWRKWSRKDRYITKQLPYKTHNEENYKVLWKKKERSDYDETKKWITKLEGSHKRWLLVEPKNYQAEKSEGTLLSQGTSLVKCM